MGIILLVLLFSSIMKYFSCGVKDVPMHQISALRGETIYLPCNVTTYEGDDVVLILWYRNDKGTPIYSVDIRGENSKAARRWSDDAVFGERAYFIFNKEPGKLSVQNTQDSDTGMYRCRVDFVKAQTRNSNVQLTVIEPPDEIIIRDETGAERSTVVGPYSEGDVVSLRCKVKGGTPPPEITWYRDGSEIISETNFFSKDKSIQSEISLGPLSRRDLNSRLTCKASNHPRTSPLKAVVQIDMNFAPLNIRLLGARQPLSSGRRYDLLCQSAGSRPPAAITWWINGFRLEKTTETTSSDGNQTTSTLSITLSKIDTGKYLSCKAYNHAVPSEPLEDGWKLDIQYIPEAFVRLGTSLDSNSIREGTDVYFDCFVLAHPSAYRIEWRHNDRTLPHNISQGVIISNHSLVLQGVTKATAGNYSCVGYNAEGEGTSAPFKLDILYAPTCAPHQPRIYGVAKQEDAQIKCTVDANPPEVDFSWTFNNSAESIDVATNHIARLGTSSMVTYTPITELDYGTLLCIATNKIGRQRLPCVFHIIAAGRPDQVHNCTLTNISMTSLTITCSDGFNGGLPQLFILELRDMNSNDLKANITSTTPRFSVSSLSPGNPYMLSIYAFNSKGKSDPTTLSAAMLRMPEKQLTSEHAENSRSKYLFSPVVSLSIGLTLTVMVAGLAVILALRIPCKNTRRHRKEVSVDNYSRDGSPGPSDKSSASKEIDGNESDEKTPDVVPEAIDDSDDQEIYVRRRQHVSTIDATYSPTRGLLSITPPPQNFNTSAMTLHTSHNVGYCSLRNGMQAPTSMGTMTMNDPPHIYSDSFGQYTLPRHTNQKMCPPYTGVGAEVQHLQSVSLLHQLTLQPTLKSHDLQQSLHTELVPSATSGNSLCSTVPNIERTIAMQHINQNQKGRVCISNNKNFSPEPNCLSDDEATVQTPLMVKRESTV